MAVAQSAFGLLALAALAWLMSEDRRRPPWRVAAVGLGVQIGLALLLLKLPPVRAIFLVLNDAIMALDRATTAGTAFVFGYVGGGPAPFEVAQSSASFVLAFRALPLILVVSALSALLFHWRVLPAVVRGFAWLLERTMGVGGAVGAAAAANVFVGMVEAPLFVRPYLARMSRSELFVVMTCGMATVAGTVMALYAAFLGSVVPNALGNILTASLISAPAAITVARLMVPEAGAGTGGGMAPGREHASAMEALVKGTADGVLLLINVIAMLIVLVALVALANEVLGLLPGLDGTPLTLQRLAGYALAPLAWLAGVPWDEVRVAGALFGTKVIVNELVAYLELARLPPDALAPRSRLIMTYALCGFANFGSLGIMIGGLATMVPERRREVVGLGLKSIVAGMLATTMTGAIVGILEAGS